MRAVLTALELAAAIIALVTSSAIALRLIILRVGPIRRYVTDRWVTWLRGTIGDVVEERLLATNGGSTIYDRVSSVELHTRDTQRSVEGLDERFDHLASEMAVVAETAREVRREAEHRADRLEDRMDEGFTELRRAVLFRLGVDRPESP
jgi:hypothetical protein